MRNSKSAEIELNRK